MSSLRCFVGELSGQFEFRFDCGAMVGYEVLAGVSGDWDVVQGSRGGSALALEGGRGDGGRVRGGSCCCSLAGDFVRLPSRFLTAVKESMVSTAGEAHSRLVPTHSREQ